MPINLPLVDAYWRVGSLFSDSPADADRDPDIGWADEGTAILAPVVGNLRYTDENGRMATLTNAPKVGIIKAGGRIAWEADSAAVDNTIRLVDLTDPSITGYVSEPGAKTHTLTVRNVKVDGVAVFGTRTDFDVRISLDTAGPDGVVNLAEQVPLEAAAPIVVDLRKGDQGVGVESVDQDAAADGDLVLNLTDGSNTTPVPLPPGVLPDDAQLATALGQPQAKGALSAHMEEKLGEPTTQPTWALPRTDTGTIKWTTTQEAVARALGWWIATDPRFAGGMGPARTAIENAAALQAAIDAAAASTSRGTVYIPAGNYTTRQVVRKRGTVVVGAGVGGFGTNGDSRGTTLRQPAGAAEDLFRYDFTVASNGNTYAGPCGMHHLELVGDSTGTVGYGMNFTTPDDRPCVIQDTLDDHHILFRQFPQGGVLFPKGALPLHYRDCNFLWNGGPGVTYKRGSSATQAVHFDNLSGDGNRGGIIRIENDNSAEGEFLITNLKSESRINPYFGGVGEQTSPVVLKDCPAPVTIHSANHYSSIDSGPLAGVAPGPLISVESGHVAVTWMGVAIATDGQTGTSLIIDDTPRSQSVPYTRATGALGVFGRDVDLRLLSSTALGRLAFGRPGSIKPDVLTHAVGVSGETPGFYLWENDAADANEKLWSVGSSGGNLYIRTHVDAGSAGATIIELQRNGTAVGAAVISAPIRPFSSTTSQRRAASQAGVGAMAYDTTLGKPIWSDGSVWRDASGAVI
jgi:hypothetical protein